MVVTGFEIYGAVGTSIALLNMARQGFQSLKKDYKDYKNFGQEVAKTHRSCEHAHYLIEEWSKYWDLDERRSDELYRAYWGVRGWQLIEEQLAAVMIQCEGLASIIDKALPRNIYDQIPRADRECIEARLHERAQRAESGDASHSQALVKVAQMLKNKVKNDGWKFKILDIHVLEEHITNATTPWKKANYILRSCDQLQTHLKNLDEDFRKLAELAEKAWRDRHGTDHMALSMTDRQIIALSEKYKPVLREAKTHREETKALHHCCTTTPDILKLEMNLLDGAPAENQSKVFRIFVPRLRRKVHLEVATRILGNDAPTNEVRFRNDFPSACEEAHKGGQCLLWTWPGVKLGTVASRQRIWFSLCKAADPLYQNELSISSLSMGLRDITIAEKLELAYSVVESSLVLLGTPWLSALSSQTLQQYKVNNRQPSRYVLSIKANTPDPIGTLFQLERGALELCIVRVGIVLTEIALETVVQDFKKTSQGLQLVITEQETRARRQCSLQLIVHKAKVTLGVAYSEAIGFCLQDPRESGKPYDPSFNEEEKAMELLDMCFDKILVK